jgi:hypothetical protein
MATFRIYMPHQNLRCWGFKVGWLYLDLCPFDTGLQVYVNPWPGKPHRWTGRRRWFYLHWLRPVCWLLNR